MVSKIKDIEERKRELLERFPSIELEAWNIDGQDILVHKPSGRYEG